MIDNSFVFGVLSRSTFAHSVTCFQYPHTPTHIHIHTHKLRITAVPARLAFRAFAFRTRARTRAHAQDCGDRNVTERHVSIRLNALPRKLIWFVESEMCNSAEAPAGDYLQKLCGVNVTAQTKCAPQKHSIFHTVFVNCAAKVLGI